MERPVWKQTSFYGFLLLSALLALWLADPAATSASGRAVLERCAAVVVPSLFPFFVLTNLLVRRSYHRYAASALGRWMGPVLGVPADAAGALVLGALGGYPVGAAALFRLYDQKQLSARQVSRALAFCNNGGPGYILGVVGLGLLGSVRLGVTLWAVHILAAVLTGILLRPRTLEPSQAVAPTDTPAGPFAVDFIRSVQDAAVTCLYLCGFLVFFGVLLGTLSRLLPPLPSLAAAGVLELSTGMALLTQQGLSVPSAMIWAAAFLGWGGLCVHCQVLSLRGDRPIQMGPYFLGKGLQCLLSVALVRLLTVRDPLPLLAVLAAALLPRLTKTSWKFPARPV